MKKITLSFCLVLFSILAHAQNGLECVVVETYYVSDANDTNANSVGGILPVGSTTYRIYADMLQGYKFQAAYGVPGHELRIETSTNFFNNEDRGATTPNYTKNQAKTNTVMLDSWFSVGAGCTNNFGIMKSNDDGVANIVNNFVPQVCQNNNASAGIPLTTQDGLIAGSPEQVTFVGFSTADLDPFDATSQYGNLLSTYNASWASLNGSVGPDSVDNKVLIAQMTTNGAFFFKLNIQIGTPTGGVENYVAENPVGNEIQLPCLIYNSLTVDAPEQHASASEFSVYPNPAKDLLTINFKSPDKKNQKVEYSIYDLTGKIILSKVTNTSSEKYHEQIDISSLINGVYVLELNVDGVSSHKKIIKY